MSKCNRTLMACLLAGVAIATPVHAGQEQGRAMTLTALDYAEIQQLYYKYHWMVDAVDAKGWANLFTPDGTYESGGGQGLRAKGHEELKALVVKSMNGGPLKTNPLGLVTNIWVEPAADGTVRGGSYMVRINPPDPEKGTTISSVTVYLDVLVKTPEGWRIKNRRSHGGENVSLVPSIRQGTSPAPSK
jgi:hypothetical protein